MKTKSTTTVFHMQQKLKLKSRIFVFKMNFVLSDIMFSLYAEQMKNNLEQMKGDILGNIREHLDSLTTEMLGRKFCKQLLGTSNLGQTLGATKGC